MEIWHYILVGIYSIITFLSVIRFILVRFVHRDLIFLDRQSPTLALDAGQTLPTVSIIVPVKDEAATISDCMRSLLAINYPNKEILIVDDRSTDQSAAMVRQMAQQHPSIKLHQIRELPVGWTGKTHALHHAQQHARGDWLLFVDADTTLAPASLGIILRDAIDHQADLESLLPRLDMRSFWERIVQPYAGICLMALYPINRAKTRGSDHAFANGQFILIKRAVYDAIGGHLAVRDKFVEDIHLGRNVQRAGYHLRVAVTPELVAVRMYSTLRRIIKGWSRIFYSASNAQPETLARLLLAIFAFSVIGYSVAAMCFGVILFHQPNPFIWTMFGLTLVHHSTQVGMMGHLYGLGKIPRIYLLGRMLAVGVMIVILIKTIRLCYTRKVEWRGTHYGSELVQSN